MTFPLEDGEFIDPLVGEVHYVSWKEYVAANPQRTFLQIRFVFIPRS